MIVDTGSRAWCSDFGNQFVGELDPQDRQGHRHQGARSCAADQPKGSLDMEFDPDGNIWVGMSIPGQRLRGRPQEQGGEGLSAAAGVGATSPPRCQHGHADARLYVDNKVWMTDTETHNPLPARSSSPGGGENKGEATSADGKKRSATMGCRATRTTTSICSPFGDTRISTLDAKTNVAQIWATLTPRSRQRRGRLDDQGHVLVRQICRQCRRDVRVRATADQGIQAADGLERRPTT